MHQFGRLPWRESHRHFWSADIFRDGSFGFYSTLLDKLSAIVYSDQVTAMWRFSHGDAAGKVSSPFLYPTMIQEICRVIRLEALSVGTWRLFLAAPVIAARVHAGQFVMVGIGAGYDPLLRRPFSVHFAENGRLVLYFRVVGKGTEMLAALRPGNKLSLLGPLGNGFTLTQAPARLVGGGIGIAPLLLLAKELADQGGAASAIILAGRAKAEVAPLAASFQPWTKNLIFATDDGSFGMPGRAGDALASLPPAPGAVVYACGPQPMLAAIACFCRDKNMKCQVSVESAMACGMGACLGCARPVAAGGHVHVCLDGPVFDAEALPWN